MDALAPILNPINKGAEATSNFLNRFAGGALDALSLGTAKKYVSDNYSNLSPGAKEMLKPLGVKPEGVSENIADFTGEMAGMLVPYGGAYKATAALSKGINVGLPKLLQAANRGLIAGATYGTAKELAQAAIGDKQTLDQRLQDIAFESATAGAGDAAFGLAGKGLGALAKKYPDSRLGQLFNRAEGSTIKPNEEPPVNVNESSAMPDAEIPPSAIDEHILKPKDNPNLAPPDAPYEPFEFTLPRNLAGSKPRYNIGQNQYIPQFESDFDRALFIISQKQKSAKHDDFVRALVKSTGLSEEELFQLAQQVRNHIKSTVKGQPTGNIVIPRFANEVYRPPKPNKPIINNVEEVINKPDPTQPQVEPSKPINEEVNKPNVANDANATKPEKAPEIKVDAQGNPLPEVAPKSEANAPKPDNTEIPNERGFNETVRKSEHTSPEVSRILNEKPETYTTRRTSFLYEEAQDYIKKAGIQGAHDFVMNADIVKDKHNAVAQILAKIYQSQGDTEKAIDIIAKTAKSGTELGRAIQALTLWNKMDAEGALLLGQRQLNKANAGEYRTLSKEQAENIVAASAKIQEVEKTKSLAEKVMDILTNKAEGENFTDDEIAIIKEFQDQVKEIDGKVKKFLPKEKKAKVEKKVKDFEELPPEKKTRETLVDYWEARERLAKEKLAKQKNVQIIADTNNPLLLYAEIGVAKLMKGSLKLEDFTEKMVQEFGESIRANIEEIYNKSMDLLRKSQNLPTSEQLDKIINKAAYRNNLNPVEAEQLKEFANNILNYTDDNLRIEAINDLHLTLRRLGDSTLGQKASSFRNAAMLLNEVTIARNAIGNAGFMAQEKVTKMMASPIDWGRSTLTGADREIYFHPLNQEKYWRNFMIGLKSGWKGTNPTGSLTHLDIHPEAFGDKNPLKYMMKLLGATQQSFDYATYRQAYGEVLATYAENLGRAKGMTRDEIKKSMPALIKQLDESIFEMAEQAGEYATFQDKTLLAMGASSVKRGLNKVTDVPSQKLVEAGVIPRSMSMEGFGLGDIAIAFAKTPANLVMRGLDYSPAGIFRAAYHLLPLVTGKPPNNRKAIMALSRAVTGTLGLSGFGFILAKNGILTGSASMDKDVRSIQEQAGMGAYKVNWSALARFLHSGFDKEAAKFQEGDKLMDYAWLQPAAISLAMGVNANKAWNDKSDDTTGWKKWGKAILGGFGTVLENPMVKGLSDIVDASMDILKKNDATKAGAILKGVPASFIPTLIGQARTATDNYQRETFDSNIGKETLNIVKNKIPGLSKTLPISRDSLGNDRERIQGGEANTVGQYLTSFLSPAKTTEYKVSNEAKLVLDLMNQSGDANVLPRIVNKYITVDNPKTKKPERLDLNAEQFSNLQQKVGQDVAKRLKQSATMLGNPNVKQELKIKKVKDILNEAGQKATNDLRQELGYRRKP
jgi:hypothetical protein